VLEPLEMVAQIRPCGEAMLDRYNIISEDEHQHGAACVSLWFR
jgi:hypothetical protein